ncbi:MAG TPA: hypothetical protein VG871_18185 [Vicinamibacterales bacterium]|nr:hypothetical protein [Vicinamibacterales bacterium]
MFARIVSAAAVGVLLLGLTAQPTRAANGWVSNYTHREFLTFSAPVALPGIVLAAGTYAFEVPEGGIAFGLVRVSSRDGKTVYLTQFARVVDRPSDIRADLHVTFGEAARGAVQPINTWYPTGENSGRQFIYK